MKLTSFLLFKLKKMIDFAISYVRNSTQDELAKYLKSKIKNVDKFDLAEYINSLETFMDTVQYWFSNSFYCPELPNEVYVNEFKERIVNEMAIFISFGLLEEDDACYDDSYC